MNTFEEILNDTFVSIFNSILKVEEQMVKSMGRYNLSISEIHLIESVGKNNNVGKTISEIAKTLAITLPSVTIAVNKLEKKGYLEKRRSPDDGRSVSILLTDRGKKIDRIHRHFHEQMIKAITNDLSEDEKIVLLKSIKRLNDFFRQKAGINL